MQQTGWIKLHRSVQTNWLWDDKPFSRGQAWIDLLLLANHSDGKGISKGQPVEYKTGTVHYSILSLSERWGWSRHKVRDFLDALERDHMVVQKRTPQGTSITIENWGVYQTLGTPEGTTEGQQKDNKRTQTIINKNKKNNKNVYSNRFNTFDSREYPDKFFEALERTMTQ